jgi:hypothetical protein
MPKKDTPDIYTVTSYYHTKAPGNVKSRTWGWFPTLEMARRTVEVNDGDMQEFRYNYIIVENVPWGILAYDRKVEWYKWVPTSLKGNRCRGNWVRCRQPSWAKNTVGWSMG